MNRRNVNIFGAAITVLLMVVAVKFGYLLPNREGAKPPGSPLSQQEMHELVGGGAFWYWCLTGPDCTSWNFPGASCTPGAPCQHCDSSISVTQCWITPAFWQQCQYVGSTGCGLHYNSTCGQNMLPWVTGCTGGTWSGLWCAIGPNCFNGC